MIDFPGRHSFARGIRLAAIVLCLQCVAGMALAASHDETAPPLTACTGTYALCTSAPCIGVPGAEIRVDTVKGDASLCECEVVYGVNVALTPCDGRTTSLISAYSYAETGGRKLLSCDDGQYTNCLDAPCDFDPEDPTKARCTCPIVDGSGDEWVTFGGDCREASCSQILWSAASLADIGAANCVLNEVMGLDVEPSDDPALCNGPYATCDE